ncbi:MAG: ABC transporter ATP-binding protein [Planctomycetales bacterium]|nr:ABC transporter ATP-binding protein [Planctomycetales bacterium]
MQHVLQVEGAERRFGSTHALCGADLHVLAGEVMALLGPNGAGKTTLIRSIVGRIRLDQGRIEMFGKTICEGGSAISPDQHTFARLGVVPQEIAVYPDLNAMENLRCFAELQGMARTEIQEQTAWVLEWTGLQDRAKDLAKTYSGGMKRRLNIGCSMMHRPQLLLLDEPTVGVDPQSRQRIWEMLQQLQREGTSILLTTHQLDEAQQISDRITIIDHGKTAASGSFDELCQTTIGLQRRVIIVSAQPIAPESLPTWEVDQHLAVCRVNNVATELADVLAVAKQAGVPIRDVQIEAPSLQAIFIHLTGKELRD